MSADHGHRPEDGHSHAHEDLLPLSVVQEMVLSRSRPLETISLSPRAGLGHFLAADVVVEEEIPPFANSAMDGYAVRSSDTERPGAELSVVGVLPAGSPPPAEELAAGQAVQIMTGAVMPPGADCVAMVERIEKLPGGRIRVLDAVAEGANVRPAGSDFSPGQVPLRSGMRVGPAQVAVLASLGRATVEVHRRPKVGVVSTGDELVGPEAELEPGQIRDSNREMLLSCLIRDGFEPVDLGVVQDREDAVEQRFRQALSSCDAVLSSGGVSKGEFDYVKKILASLAEETGGESFELGVAIRPAKPLALGFVPTGREQPVVFFGLPGNPVSSLVSYQVVALPALARMAGDPVRQPRRLPAVASEELRPSRDGRLNLVRVEAAIGADGRIIVRPAGGQQSHQLSGTVSANALALVPSGPPVEAGSSIEIIPLSSIS